MAAPTRVQTYISAIGTGGSKQITGIALQAGDIVVIDGATYDNAGTDVFTTAPTGGSGLTWTQKGVVAVSGLESRKAWTSPVGAAQTAAITVATTATGHVWVFTVTVWRNHGGVGAALAGHNGTTGGTPSLALTGVLADSAIQYGNGDWNLTTGARTYLTTGVGAATEINYFNESEFHFNAAVWANTGAAGSKTVGQSAPTGQRWAAIAIEIKGSTGTTHDGAAALSGAGTLTASATRVHPGGASLSGQGTQTAAVNQGLYSAANLAVAGTLTAAVSQGHGAGASLASAGSMTSSAGRELPGAVSMSAAGTLQATVLRDQPVEAAFAGVGTIQATAGTTGEATLSGVGTLVADTQQDHAATADLAAAGTLTAAASSDQRITAALSGTGTMDTAAARVHPSAVSLAGAGSMTADGTRVHPGEVALTGTGSLTVGGIRVATGALTMSGQGTLTAQARAAAGGVLNVSLWGVDRATGALIPLPHFTKLTVSPIRNSPGSISVEYPVFGKNFALLRDNVTRRRDLEVEIWLSGSRDHALRGYLSQKSGDDVAETAVWQFAGHFMEQRLTEVLVYPQNGDPKKELRVSGVTAGQVAILLHDQAKARGALTDITRDFTTTHDSDGLAWPDVVNAKWSPGKTTFLQVLGKLVELGMCEFEITANKVLRLYRFGGRGTDRTTGLRPVIFRRGYNVTEASHRESSREGGTDALVDGSEGLYAQASNATALAERGRRVEVSASAGNIENQGALDAYAQKTAQTAGEGVDERDFGLTFGVGHPRPGVSFGIGDLVQTDTAGTLDSSRVSQWTLTSEVSGYSGSATTGDLIADRLLAMHRRLEEAQNGGAVVGTSTATPVDDTVPPAAPTGLVADSIAYQDSVDSATYASVTVGWSPVTTNADGSADPKVQAAQLILDRMQSGLGILEDWTWAGAPEIVFAYNDALLAEWNNSGDAAVWLQAYIDAHTGVPSPTDDVAGYRVRYAYLGLGQVGPPYTGAPDPVLHYYEATPYQGTSGTAYTFGGVGAGADIEVQVAAFDNAGNQSAWSTGLQFTTAVDNTPPPTPAAATLAVWFRTIDITSNGLGSAGEPMPVDWDHNRVWLSQAASFTVPDGPSNPVAFNPNATGPQHVANLYSAGTWNQPDIPIGVGWYAALQAVDRAGNASPLSTIAGPVTAEQLVQIDIGPDAIGQQQIIDLEVVRGKIANLAVNSAKVEELQAGLITTGTLMATVTLSGIIRTGTTGLRWEGDPAGIRFYNASDELTIRLEGAAGNSLFVGTIQSGLAGQRWVMLPAGEWRLYPAAGSAYSRMWNLGNDIAIRGPLNANGRSGRVNVNTGGVGLNFSSENDLGNLRSEIALREKDVRITTPVHQYRVDRQFTPASGVQRAEWIYTDSSGVDIGRSLMLYQTAGGNEPWIQCPIVNSGWIYGPNYVIAVDNQGLGSEIRAAGWTSASSRLAKCAEKTIEWVDPHRGDVAVTPLDVILSAEAKEWEYLHQQLGRRPAKPGVKIRRPRLNQDGSRARDADGYELWDDVDAEWDWEERPAPKHYGPMAEDLKRIAPTLVRSDPETPNQLFTDLRDLHGVLWAAVGQLSKRTDAQIAALRAEIAALRGTRRGPVVVDGVVEEDW